MDSKFLSPGLKLCGSHSITSGRLLSQVLQNERKGKYLGETVRFSKQVVKLELDLITEAAALPIDGSNAEVCLVELGGSVGGAAECGVLGWMNRVPSASGNSWLN